MKNCFKRLLFSHTGALSFFLFCFSGCTTVDDTLGLGLLPKDQDMVFRIENLDGIKSYITIPDSIPTNQLNKMIIGNYETDGYGRIRGTSIVQFSPASDAFENDDYYGYKPYIDSVQLNLYIYDIYGDTSIPQKFYVYPVTEKIKYDSLYYADFDAESLADMDNPLFSFVMVDEERGEYGKNLTIEPAGEQFLNDLISLDKEIYEKHDSVFRETFKGFYIAPSNNISEAPLNSALYELSPLTAANSYYIPYDYNYFVIFAHNHEEESYTNPIYHDGETCGIKDTLEVRYTFDDSGISISSANVSITTMSHDYSSYPSNPSSLINPALFIDPETFLEDNPTPLETVYVQGMLGVSSYLYFDDEFVERLQKLRIYNGEECTMFVNRAMIYIWLEDDVLSKLDLAPSRLGMYYDYKGLYPVNIPDYLYYDEIYNAYTPAYGGYLNRSLGRYEMDISMYIRALANKPEDTKRQIWLAPAMNSAVMYTASQVAIQNKGDDPDDPRYRKRIQIDLSYSLLNKK